MFLKFINKFLDLIDIVIQRDYYGFIQGHSYIKKKTIDKIKKDNSNLLVRNFENKFSSLIGDGDTTSFASARMCFYAFMKAIGIKEKDEVIEDIFATSEQTEIEIQKPKLKDVITEKVENEVESIEKIEKDFERCNLLFIKRIYGKRVHRRKIMELESKVDRLKSLGKVSEDYNLY